MAADGPPSPVGAAAIAGRGGLLDAVFVLSFGVLALTAARTAVPPGLIWSDEITYAIVARNIAAGHGPLSSFHHPDTVLARGLPSTDVHMPGHAYLLALAYRAAGVSEVVAETTGRVAFLAAGAIVYGMARRAYGRGAGLWAAVLLYAFPGLAAYACSAMSEPTLLFVAAVWWALWREGLATGRWIFALGLGVVLAAGATHRETFAAFLPAAVYALARWPGPHRRRAVVLAGASWAAGMCLVFWPLYRARAPYPHALSFLLDAADGGGLAEAIGDTLALSLRPWSRPDTWLWVYALEWAVALGAAALALRGPRANRALGLWGAVTFLVVFAGLAPLYWLRGWTAVRMFLFTLPPCLVALAGGAGPGASRLRRHLVPAIALVVFIAVGVAANDWVGRDRREQAEQGRAYAAFIRSQTRGVAPRVVIAPGAYRYGWEDYPVAVIDSEIDAGHLVALERRIEIDAVVTGRKSPHLWSVLRERGFVPASDVTFQGRQVFVRSAAVPAP